MQSSSLDIMTTPLEILYPDKFEDFDDMQRKLICKYGALDLILLENANELFRRFMLEGEEDNIEKLLEKFKEENSNSLFLRSDTVEIKQIEPEGKESYWAIKDTKTNDKTIKQYITDTVKKIKESDINSESVIYTIFGLNLVAGGHYGSIVCDLKLMKVFVFDSMTGESEYGGIVSGSHEIFIEIAKLIFNNERVKKAIMDKLKKSIKLERLIKSIFKKRMDKLKSINFKFEPVKIGYILQPTGGFEDFISPDLESIEDKELQMEINIQHSESQNHFCYIWSCLFCNIYLRGKMQLLNKFLLILSSLNIIPLAVIKMYILGFVPLLENETTSIEHKEFFNKHFPRIWSNHENVATMDYKLYELKYKKSENIKSVLDNVLNINNDIKNIPVVNAKKVKEIIKCIEDEEIILKAKPKGKTYKLRKVGRSKKPRKTQTKKIN